MNISGHEDKHRVGVISILGGCIYIGPFSSTKGKGPKISIASEARGPDQMFVKNDAEQGRSRTTPTSHAELRSVDLPSEADTLEFALCRKRPRHNF